MLIVAECPKLRASRDFVRYLPYVPMCSRALRACVPSCLCFVRAFNFLRALSALIFLSTCLMCLQFFTCLTCSKR